ncbi:MAG: ParB/RepB/Spo0J family partition protein [Oscillospiraceae bacterium]|jgi:ParB family chromosome partitioning protein|nr:ParB/RepB/Spo0J family partition protein [Oscillospiraceae bacterium]
MKPKGLGRGLDALLSDVSEENSNNIREIPLGDIDPNRDQPRKQFEPEALRQLADSIAQAGIIQPIIVCPTDGRYQIVAGERRWRAARLAGLTVIPAIIREADTIGRMEIALIENLQREDLNPMEEALAIRALMDECGLTQESVSQRLGRSRSAIANQLRLLTLPAPIQELVAGGKLSAGHARTLAALDNRTRQIALAQRAIDEGWSVRMLEQELSKKEQPARVAVNKTPPPEFERIASNARETFGLRVQVSGSLKKGRIVLRYDRPEELEHFYSLLEEMRG